VATYQFSALADGQAISFNPNSDVLNFDQTSIAAGAIRVTTEGSNLRLTVVTGPQADKDIVLVSVSQLQLATSNVMFADGSRLLFGDNSPSTAGDGGANLLVGTAGMDQLVGFGGADTLRGGAGSDTYFVSTGDVVDDTSGWDFVYSDVSWSLAPAFGDGTLTLTGSGAISGQGNNSDNVIVGNDAANVLNGRAGNDAIHANGGNDTIDMSAGGTSSYGNDSIDGGAGVDTLDFLGANALGPVDVFLAGNSGRAGNNQFQIIGIENVVGGAFDDTIYGSNGANFLFGGTGNDILTGGAGSDTLQGGAGTDSFAFVTFPAVTGVDRIIDFSSGTDKLRLDRAAFANIGAEGNFAPGDDRFMAGPGFNSAREASDRVVYNTTTGQLWYDADGMGGDAAQLVATLQGNPALAATDIVVFGQHLNTFGTAGNDSIVGGPGNDMLDGRAGNDTIEGLGGNDSLIGGNGDDRLVGGDGLDTLQGGWNNDDLDGGSGFDTVWLSGAVSSVAIDLVAGTMTGGDATGIASARLVDVEAVEHSDGLFYSLLAHGSSRNEYFRGGSARDTIHGGGGDDTIYGSSFATNADGDELYGGDGNDLIASFGGNTQLDGGAGNDVLGSGPGAERLVFSVAPGAANADLVTEFASGFDKIVLDSAAHPNIGASGNFASGDDRFMAGPGFTSAREGSDRVVYDTLSGRLYYDADGLGGAQSQLIATLQGAPALAATDIGVIAGTNSGSVIGTAGNDTISGTSGDDIIDGLAGNDRIEGDPVEGPSGHDSIIGGSGNDTINGRGGNDTLLGGDGADSFSMDSSVSDFSYTRPGNDSIDGGGGIDGVFFSTDGVSTTGAVTMDLAAGTYSVADSGGVMNGTIANVENAWGSFLDDNILGNALANWIGGGTGGDDMLHGAGGDDTLWGFSGNDRLFGGDGNDSLFGDGDFPSDGHGDDTLDGAAGADTMDGRAGDDTYFVDSSGDVLIEGAGQGTDAVLSRATSFTMGAHIENLWLDGVENIAARGNELANLLIGNPGNNTLDGAAGADTMDGRAGDDTYLVDNAGDQVAEGAGQGTDAVLSRATSFTMGAHIENLWLDGVENIGASGNELGNLLIGNPGNNVLRGAGGNDVVDGRDGADQIHGGAGVDTLDGGAGADRFVFDEAAGGANADRVNDFAPGADELVFQNGVFTALGAAGAWGAGDGRFHAGAGASAGQDADDRLVYDTLTGNLYYDADGAGGMDAQIVATLANLPALSASDITVV
jgi:trimeric autotransporter adhesin